VADIGAAPSFKRGMNYPQDLVSFSNPLRSRFDGRLPHLVHQLMAEQVLWVFNSQARRLILRLCEFDPMGGLTYPRPSFYERFDLRPDFTERH
jgi:hypothetical protein